MGTAASNALAIVRETGNVKWQAWVLSTLATLQQDESADDTSMDSLGQAIELDQGIGDRAQLVEALSRYAEAQRRRGEFKGAQTTCDRARSEAEKLADPYSLMLAEESCAAIALAFGRVEEAEATLARARGAAEKLNNTVAVATMDAERAVIDVGLRRWVPALEWLGSVVDVFAGSEAVAEEAKAQGELALCYQALNRPVERDRALVRGRELRSRITARYEVLSVDIALARLDGEIAGARQGVGKLSALADDASSRHWVTAAAEARLAMLELMERDHDPAAGPLRSQLLVQAHQLGFEWMRMRLQAKDN